MANLLLDDYLSRNPDSLVTITHDRLGIGLTGIISDPQLTQNLSASYGQGVQSAVTGAAGSLFGGAGKLGGILASATSALSSHLTSKHTLMGTVKIYEGSGDVSIPFNIDLFYNWGGNPDYKAMDLQLNLLTQPRVLNDGLGLLGSNLYEPSDLLGLIRLNTELLKGKLISVSLGQWFLAKDVFITGISKSASTVLNEEGSPISLRVSFQIEPYRQLTAQELNEWIIT